MARYNDVINWCFGDGIVQPLLGNHEVASVGNEMTVDNTEDLAAILVMGAANRSCKQEKFFFSWVDLQSVGLQETKEREKVNGNHENIFLLTAVRRISTLQ